MMTTAAGIKHIHNHSNHLSYVNGNGCKQCLGGALVKIIISLPQQKASHSLLI